MIVTTEICFICGRHSDFSIIDGATLLREAKCNSCGSSLRNSDTAKIIVRSTVGKEIPLTECVHYFKDSQINILEAQASGSIHSILKILPHYLCFEYFDDVDPGEYKNGILSNDLMNLSFEDNTFDLVITQDVMEHVPNPEVAFQQINRVLKIGGQHIFTIPLHEANETKSRRNLRSVYHGDPQRINGSVVHTDWGYDICDIIDKYGMKTETFKIHNFHKAEEITEVDRTYSAYLSNDPLKYYRYNSVVFASQKEFHYFNKTSKANQLKLISYGPDNLIEGTKFNVQPNGESALWAETENASKSTVLLIDDVELESYIHTSGDLVTAIVPEWLYSFAGEYSIYLYDSGSKMKSNKLKFLVKPSTTEITNKEDMTSYIKKLQNENLTLNKQLIKLENKKKPKFDGCNMISDHEFPWIDNYKWKTFRESSKDIKRIFNFGLYEDIGIQADNVDTLLWRHWIVAFSIRYALEFKLKNDVRLNLVECGVGDGMSAFFALREIQNSKENHENIDFTMHLYDSWDYICSEDLTEEETTIKGRNKNDSIERVQSNLQEFETNLKYHVGYIPETLTNNPKMEQLLYLHIDLNSAKATMAALEYFYPLMAHGGIIIFDDYGCDGFSDTKEFIDQFFSNRPGILLKLPTGQALYFYR